MKLADDQTSPETTNDEAAQMRQEQESTLAGQCDSIERLCTEFDAPADRRAPEAATSNASELARGREALKAQQLEMQRLFEEQKKELERMRSAIESQRAALAEEHSHWQEQVTAQKADDRSTASDNKRESALPLKQTPPGDDSRPHSFAAELIEKLRKEADQKANDPAKVNRPAGDQARGVEAGDEATHGEVASEPVEGKGDRSHEAEEAELREAIEPVPSRPASTGQMQPSGDDEESIEDYMAALLNRMRGGNDDVIARGPAPRRRQSDQTFAEQPPVRKEEPKTPVSIPETPVIEGPAPLKELTRRSQPMEKTDFSAMRELANTHARIVIDVHSKKRLVKAMLANAALAVAAFAGTAAAFHFLAEEQRAFRLGALSGVLPGLYWTFVAARSAKKLVTTPARRKGGLRASLEAEQAKSQPESE